MKKMLGRCSAPVAAMFVLAMPATANAAVNLTTLAYTQDFNSLANTGTSSTLPLGWSILEAGANANTTYAAGTGSINTGNTYSFGAAGSTERALAALPAPT